MQPLLTKVKFWHFSNSYMLVRDQRDVPVECRLLMTLFPQLISNIFHIRLMGKVCQRLLPTKISATDTSSTVTQFSGRQAGKRRVHKDQFLVTNSANPKRAHQQKCNNSGFGRVQWWLCIPIEMRVNLPLFCGCHVI